MEKNGKTFFKIELIQNNSAFLSNLSGIFLSVFGIFQNYTKLKGEKGERNGARTIFVSDIIGSIIANRVQIPLQFHQNCN